MSPAVSIATPNGTRGVWHALEPTPPGALTCGTYPNQRFARVAQTPDLATYAANPRACRRCLRVLRSREAFYRWG